MEKELLNLEYRPDTKILYSIWSEDTRLAKWEEMQTAFYRYAEIIEKHVPQFILVDERQLDYVWSPCDQDWIDKEIIPHVVKPHLKKIAIVQSQEVFIAVALEQLMQEENAKALIQGFFNTIEDAEKWLLS